MNPALVTLLDRYTNEAFTFSPTIVNASGAPITDADVDNVMYCKGFDGLYYKRNITGPINVRLFGAKGDGITDDTGSINKAMRTAKRINEGGVEIPAGTFLINDLHIVSGISLRGTAGSTYAVGGEKQGILDLTNPGSSRLKIASGGQGITCSEMDKFSGGSVEDITIIGHEDGTSIFGLKITDVGWSTKNVSIDYFPTNVGFWIGWCWRATHTRLQIRRCGLAFYSDGALGPINGLSFPGLLIENSRVGIFQSRAQNGSSFVANTFTSAIIEGIISYSIYKFPSWISVDSSILTDLSTTKENLTGAVILSSDCEFTFTGIYTELIAGITFYIGTNSTINCFGGFVSQTLPPTNPSMNGYAGGLSYSRIGNLNMIGTRVVYVDDKTINSSPLFTYTSTNNTFQSIKFTGTTGLYTRNIYERYQIADLYNYSGRWNRGLFEDQTGNILGITTSDFLKSNNFVTIPTVIDSPVGTVDLSKASGFVVINNTFSNGTNNVVTLTGIPANAQNGQTLIIVLNNQLSSGSTLSVNFSGNFRGNFQKVRNFNTNGIVTLEFYRYFGTWTLQSILNNDRLEYGVTSNRPNLTSTDVGVIYFDTTLGKPVFWNGVIWVDSLPPATSTVAGTVKQTAAQSDSIATDVAGIVADFNAFLAKQRASGQLST